MKPPVKLVPLVSVIVALGALAEGASAQSGLADNQTWVDDTYIYRPLTTIRRFQLGAAYFVDPELAKKSSIKYAYSIQSTNLQSQQQKSLWTDAIWDGLKSGKVQLLLPASKEKETVYVPITKERFESWGPNSELRISGNKIRWTNDALAFAADLQFSSKEAFKTSIGKLSTTYPSITFVSDKPLIYQANSQYSINYDDRFLSWGESSHSLFANKMEDK